MDALSLEALRDVAFFGVPGVTIALWFAAGAAAGTLLMGKRPFGLLGDLVIGVLGGFLGGWATAKTGLRLERYISGIDDGLASTLAEFLTALIGAIVVLVIIRLVVRRR